MTKKILALIGLTLSLSANAALVTYSDRTAFEAAGIIVEFQDFESYPTSTGTFPGDPWTDGSVTYYTGANAIIGSDTAVSPVSNTFSHLNSRGVVADIAGSYDMFALDIAVNDENIPSTQVLQITTNLALYNIYYGATTTILPDVQSGQLFQGWTASPGEYFVNFDFLGSPSYIHVDNVTLGNVVPVPAAAWLFGSALLGLGVVKRKKA
jgi:hypothetical protein